MIHQTNLDYIMINIITKLLAFIKLKSQLFFRNNIARLIKYCIDFHNVPKIGS